MGRKDASGSGERYVNLATYLETGGERFAHVRGDEIVGKREVEGGGHVARGSQGAIARCKKG